MPYVNNLFLVIMVIVYLLMMANGGTSNPITLVQFGAKYNPLIVDGQYWRLLTAAFIHLSFIHILLNGITLYYIGSQIETIFGHWRYLFLFIASSVGGNLASFAFNPGLSAGASTAIFGLFGAFLMIGEQHWENPQVKQMTKTFGLFIILNLGMDLLNSGIDIQGHLGGLVAGFLIAYGVGLPNDRPNRIKQGLAIITFLFLAIIMLRMGNASSGI